MFNQIHKSYKSKYFTDAPIVKRTNREATEGERNVSLVCDIRGNPSVYQVRWTQVVDGTLVQRFSEGGTRLRIPYVTVQDDGEYVCNVSNGISDPAGEVWKQGTCSLSVLGICHYWRNDVFI